jgi:competence protein ComEA
MKCRVKLKWSAFWHKEFEMQQVKFFTKILLLSFITLLPLWQLSAIAADASVPSRSEQTAMVNINTASVEQLSDGLNGVGMKRAQDIVKYREANGAFTSVEQLLAVKGIGDKVLEKNKKIIIVK